MDKEALQSQIAKAERISLEINDLKQPRSFGYNLIDYYERIREILRFFDHGERDRFFVPYWEASLELDKLIEEGEKKFDTACPEIRI